MSTTKGRDAIAKRLIKYGDPRTGKKLNAEEAHKRSGEIARRAEKKQAEQKPS